MITRGLLLLLFAVMASACSSDPYPPITEVPTYTYRYGHFVWHELATTDLASSEKFYEELFNWEFIESDTDGNTYALILNEGKHIGGMISIPDGNPTTWLGAVSVEDTENAVQTAIQNGSDVLIDQVRITGRGTMALIKDPQGAFLSFIHSSSGDPVLEEINSHEWLWMELWSENPQQSMNYYTSILPLTVEQASVDDQPYWILSADEVRAGGIIYNPITNMPSQWIPYIKVVDPEFSTQKARRLGATVLLEPTESIRNGSVAVIQDPNGAIFCLQKWPANE